MEPLQPVKSIFVNRQGPLKAFEDAAFSIPDDSCSIIVFHGAGGQGKTELLKKIYKTVKSNGERSYEFLRTGILTIPRHSYQSGEQFLIDFRNALAEAGIPTPGFDLSLALMWERWRPGQELPRLSSATAWLGRRSSATTLSVDTIADTVSGWLNSDEAAQSIGDFVGSVPAIGPVIKTLGGWVIKKGYRAYLEKSIKSTQHLFEDGDLKFISEIEENVLYWILSQDINDYIKDNNKSDVRISILIDEYENTLNEGGGGARWIENVVAKQLQLLLASSKGILLAIFSREKLDWPEVWREKLSARQVSIAGLKREDADSYLRAVPIDRPEVRAAMISEACESESSNSLVYPLMLKLQVEHWRVKMSLGYTCEPSDFRIEAPDFATRCRTLIQRLLRDYGSATEQFIQRVAFCRNFDETLYREICTHFGLPLKSEFSRISGLSLFSLDDDDRYRMHQVVSDAIKEAVSEEFAAETLLFLERHYEDFIKNWNSSQLRITDAYRSALVDLAFYKSTIDHKRYVDWLLGYTPYLRNPSSFSTGADLWRSAWARCINMLGPDDHRTRASAIAFAQFLTGLGDIEAANKILTETIRGNPSMYAASQFVAFSPTLQIARTWFDSMVKRREQTKKRDQDHLVLSAFNSLLGKYKDFNLAQESLSQLLHLGLGPDVYTYNILLNICGTFESCKSLIDGAPSSIKFSEHTVTIWMKTARTEQERSIVYQWAAKQEMRPSIVSFNVRVDSARSLSHGFEILKEIRHFGLEPNIITYTTLIKLAKDKESIEYILSLIEKDELKPDEHTIYSLMRSARTFSEATEYYSLRRTYGIRSSVTALSILAEKVNDDETFYALLSQIGQQGPAPTPKVFRAYLAKALRIEDATAWAKAATKWIKEIEGRGIALTPGLLKIFVDSAPTIPLALNMVKLLEERGFAPTSQFMLRIFVLCKNEEDVSSCLQEFHDRQLELSADVCNQICRKRVYDGPQRIIEDLETFGVKPNAGTYSLIIGTTTSLEEAFHWIREMLSKGFVVKEDVATLISRHVSSLAEAVYGIQVLRELGAILGPSFYASLVKRFGPESLPDELLEWHQTYCSMCI